MRTAKTVFWVALAVVLFSGGYALGYLRSEGRFDEGDKKLWEARENIQAYFIGEYDDGALLDAAVEGMIDSLGDEWSYYVPASAYDSFVDSTENAYVGVGVSVLFEEEPCALLVTKVVSGSSAEEAGVTAGDRIVGVDGAALQADSLAEASALVTGEEGTFVTLTLRHEDGSEADVTLERRRMQTSPVTSEMMADNVGYIRIENFDAGAGEGFEKAVTDLTDAGARALVCDVRDDPGGSLDELLDMLDLLLPAQTTIVMRDNTGAEEAYTSDADCVTTPVAVVVNEYSYSAAEFFAAALQEAGRATIVGTKTYGKGYSQVPLELSDGSAMALSVYAYFTAEGRASLGTGVTPDVTVTLTDEEDARFVAGSLALADDPQIAAAVRTLETAVAA